MKSLILVRHGETLHNVAGIAQGWQDSALSERGERQVRALARRLQSLGVDALYSSPIGRAMSTAQAIGDATGLEIRPLDDLREMNYGGWEGRSFLDVRREHEDVYRRWIADPGVACPGGESHDDVHQRMQRAMEHISGNGAANAVAVTHGTAIRIAATVLLGVPVMTSRQFAQDNAAVNHFVWRSDRWILKVWNDSTHCPE
ncbi:MAG TPA: histidine phosphatase family protein [Thermoanaerobaculia bacterium]|jgi:probable phosphoglycerate mutase